MAEMQLTSTSANGVLFVSITKKSRLLYSGNSTTPDNSNKVQGESHGTYPGRIGTSEPTTEDGMRDWVLAPPLEPGAGPAPQNLLRREGKA